MSGKIYGNTWNSFYHFVQHPESVGFIQTVATLGEFYWVATLIAEMKAGKTVDEVLQTLDEAQIGRVEYDFGRMFLFLLGVLNVFFQAVDLVVRPDELPRLPGDELN